VFDLGAALERDQRAKLELADGTLGRHFSEMRRSKYLAGPDATAEGRGMPTEIAEILRSETPQQLEIHNDARFLRRFNNVFGDFLVLWQN
jgi:hypothetical protein